MWTQRQTHREKDCGDEGRDRELRLQAKDAKDGSKPPEAEKVLEQIFPSQAQKKPALPTP